MYASPQRGPWALWSPGLTELGRDLVDSPFSTQWRPISRLSPSSSEESRGPGLGSSAERLTPGINRGSETLS
jgi:hypothetical protein